MNTNNKNRGEHITNSIEIVTPSLNIEVFIETSYSRNKMIRNNDNPKAQPLTCIHNRSLLLLTEDFNQASYTTYAVCVNFLHEYQDFQVQID